MGNLFDNLPSQAGNGSGTAVDLSTMGAEKTFIVSGTWTLPPSITIEMNDDPGQAGTWAPIKTFQGAGQITLAVVGKWFRVSVANYYSGQAPDVNVGGDTAGTTIITLVAPSGNGVGAAVDVSGLGQFKTVAINDDFTGNLTVEMSTDGTSDWAPMFSFAAPGQQSGSNTAHWARVSRSGFTSGGTPTVFVGAVDPSAAIDGVVVENAGTSIGLFQTINLLGGTISAVDQGGGVAGVSVSTSAGNVTVQQNAITVVASATVLNLTGGGVAVTNVGGVATINVPSSTLIFKDEGSTIVTAGTVNFVGSGIACTNVGGVATVTVQALAVQDEGVSVVAGALTMNFVGAGVTTTDVGGVATVTIPGGVAGIAVQDEGTPVVTSGTVNFVGAGVVATDVGGVATVTIAGGIAGVAVQDEGIPVVTASTLNFVGAGVVATNVGGVATMTIAGGIAGVAFQDEGIAVVTSATMNVVGPNLTLTNVGGVATLTGVALAVQDEGVGVVTSALTMNFVGAGVVATNVGGVATVTIAGGIAGVAVQDEGTPVVTSSTMNFVGAGVVATNVGGVATVTIAGGIAGIVFEDEGTPIVTSSTANFVGAGVTLTNVAGVATVTVPGGVTIQDDGTPIAGNPHSTLNFVGPTIAATDAGGGVTNITVSFPAKTTVTVANTPYSILATDDYLFVDTSSGAITLNLPDPTQFAYAKTYYLLDTKGTFGTNNVTLAPHSTEKISGLAANKVFQTNWGGWTIVTDSVDWYVF